MDPTTLPSTLHARALTRQADWAPKSEVGLVECGLLNPGPPARPPVRPTTGLPVHPSAQFARPPSPLDPPSAQCRPRPPSPPVRSFARAGPRPRVHSIVRTLSAPVRPTVRSLSAPFAHPLVRPTVSSTPVRSSARPLRARIVRHIRPPRPPRPLRPRETAAAIYTPPRLPSDHPAPCSPRWAPSLCCAFKDYGTARSSRTSGGWSELWGKPLQFFFCAASSMERETIYIQRDRATAAAESPRLITSGGSEAGIETPITITGGGSHSGHVVDSRGPMQELIPLGRSSVANPEDFARLGELQVGRSVVGGAEGWTNHEGSKFWQYNASGSAGVAGLNCPFNKGCI